MTALSPRPSALTAQRLARLAAPVLLFALATLPGCYHRAPEAEGAPAPAPAPAVGNFRPLAQERIVPAGAAVELVWSGGAFTEGGAAAPDGAILFSDIGNRILRYDPSTGTTTVFREPSGKANGMTFDREGRLLVCEGANGGNRRVSFTPPGGGEPQVLAERWEGKRFNSPNDLAVHASGTVYFTDPRYAGDEPREIDFEGVFGVRPGGEVFLATREVTKPNGIQVAPGGGVVYVVDHDTAEGGVRQLLVFEVGAGGMFSGKRVLFDSGADRGFDGMTLDASGRIYATGGTGATAGVYVFSPAGEHLAFIPVPGDPTNCTFGNGADAATLYITAQAPPPPAGADGGGRSWGLYRVRLNTGR